MEQYDPHKRFLCLQLKFHTQLQRLTAARSRQFWIMIQQIEAHEPNLGGNPPGLIAAFLPLLLYLCISLHHLPSTTQSVTISNKILPPVLTLFYTRFFFICLVFSDSVLKRMYLQEMYFYLCDFTWCVTVQFKLFKSVFLRMISKVQQLSYLLHDH